MKHLAVPSWTGFCHWHDSDRGSQYHTFQRDPNYTTTLRPQNKFRDMPYYFFCRCLLLSHALEGYLGAYLVRIVAPRFLTRAMRNRSVSPPPLPSFIRYDLLSHILRIDLHPHVPGEVEEEGGVKGVGRQLLLCCRWHPAPPAEGLNVPGNRHEHREGRKKKRPLTCIQD